MKTTELQNLLATSPAPRLLHVLPESVFEGARLPGSVNACIYEISFREKVPAIFPGKAEPIIVYGAGAGSRDAQVAADLLRSEGYADVTVYEEGLEGWRAAGLPLEGHGTLPSGPQAPDGTYVVRTDESLIRWTGRNLFNHHSGTVRLAGGDLTLRDGKLLAASFAVAMDSMACEDIADTAINRMLLQHLKAADFFDTANHPLATFVMSSCEALPEATDGSENFRLGGTLTLRGVSRPLEFPVVVAADGEGKLTGQAWLDLDRTEFGSIYGSGRFFRFLGQHVVNDIIHLHLKIHASRA
jgi:polyisoprenoid-binding protein YceI/rhodanese-related sulfurtransferase